MRKLDDLAMPELRELAAELQTKTGRTDIKSRKRGELVSLISGAMGSLTDSDILDVLEKFNLEARTEAELDPNVPMTGTPGEVESEEAYAKAKANGEIEETPAEAKAPIPELPYAIQIREHSTTGRYQYADVVLITKDNASICGEFTHAVLNKDGFKRLVARGSVVRK